MSGNLLGAGSAMNNNFQRFSIYMKANIQLQLAIDDLPQATKDKFTTYRQELRDLTEGIDTAEKARAVVFPDKPE